MKTLVPTSMDEEFRHFFENSQVLYSWFRWFVRHHIMPKEWMAGCLNKGKWRRKGADSEQFHADHSTPDLTWWAAVKAQGHWKYCVRLLSGHVHMAWWNKYKWILCLGSSPISKTYQIFQNLKATKSEWLPAPDILCEGYLACTTSGICHSDKLPGT